MFAVESSYTGTISMAAVGLVPAILNGVSINSGATQCFNFTVPAGTQFARWQLFNADTQGGSGTDLDLEVFSAANCTGTNVGTSAVGGSDEVVTIDNPAGTAYSARVTGYAVPAGGATYKLSTWFVTPGETSTLRVVGPSSVFEGGAASVGLTWSVPAGARYMANVRFLDGSSAVIGATKVLVDNR